MWMFWKVRQEGERSFRDNSGTLARRKETVWPQNSSQARLMNYTKPWI